MVFGGPTGSGLLASSHLDTWAKSSLKLVISMGGEAQSIKMCPMIV